MEMTLMAFVVDTHSLVWYLQDSLKLSLQQKNLFMGSRVVVPTIVLAELWHIAKRVKMSFAATLSSIEASSQIEIYPLSLDVLKTAVQFEKLEMHDALIVATAKYLALPLMTVDRAIQKSGFVAVI